MSTDINKSASQVAVPNIPETSKTDAQIQDLLIRARVKMLLSAPFFGNLATRLKFIDATKWCPTAATDGKNFYYNRNFIDALSEQELIFLMGHEVLHCVYDHTNAVHAGDRDRRLLNVAQDYVINHDLVEARIGERITVVDICYDPKYRGQTADEIYDELFEQARKDGRVFEIQTLDMHLDGDSGQSQDGESDSGNNDGTDGPIQYSKKELEQIQNEMQSAVTQAAKTAGAGNLPGGVRRLLDKLLNPQLDWRELLAMQIQSVIRSDYTWMRPSRKGQDAGFYLPGMDREQTVDLAVAIDTSGSISEDMLRDFLSEIHSIMTQYNDYTLRLWCFDTVVHNPVTITADVSADLLDYNICGGGGTDFECNWSHMKEQGITPKKFVMFTDGYPWNSWGDENYCDTLFIVHGGHCGETPVAPFGITVPYTRED
jgi:predicted metal-dependent peptidase